MLCNTTVVRHATKLDQKVLTDLVLEAKLPLWHCAFIPPLSFINATNNT